MQKVLLFLERYCQWLAIGLGVLFLGFMVYWYTPVSPTPALVVSINRAPVLPGEIDKTIDEKSTELDHDMGEKHPGFKIDAPPVLDAWQQHNALAELGEPKPLLSPFYYPGAIDNTNPKNTTEMATGEKATQLPEPPPADPASPVSVVQQRTVAIVTPPNAQPAAQPGPEGQPAQPAPAGAAPVGVNTDVDVVTTLFTIDHTKLATAFNDAFGKLTNLPPNITTQINETMILSVDLIREEQLPNGQWGNQTVIAPLPFHNIMALPPQQNPAQNQVNPFLAWVQGHSEDILEPSYYPIVKDMPAIFNPNETPPTAAVQQPATPTPQPPPFPRTNRPYPPPNNNNPRNNINNTPRRPGASHSQGMLIEPSMGAPVINAQYNPDTRPPGMSGPGIGGPGGPMANPWAPPGQNPSDVGNVINGKFDVTKLTADIHILSHDDTVVPGRTYRYMVRYTLYNSIYGIGNFAKPPELAQQLYMISKVSQPTAAINIPTRLRFFLASIFRNGVVFDVFTWKDGHWSKSRSQTMYPGDAIPGTDWSVLDVRDDLHGNGERYALLLKLDGTTERHEVKKDSDKPDFQQLQNAAAKGAQANAQGQ